MTATWAPGRHRVRGRHGSGVTVRWDRVAALVVLALATAGGVLAGVQLGHASPPPDPVTVSVTIPAWADPGITEDDPGWNCLTMGNGLCGPEYAPVTTELADVLTEASDVDRAWEACLWRSIPDATAVVCPDGSVTIL